MLTKSKYCMVYCTGTEVTYWWQAMERSCTCCGASLECWQLHWGRCSYCCCAHTPASPRQGPETVKPLSLSKPQLVQLKQTVIESPLHSRWGMRACSVLYMNNHLLQDTFSKLYMVSKLGLGWWDRRKNISLGTNSENWVWIIPSGRQRPLMSKIWHIHLWKR